MAELSWEPVEFLEVLGVVPQEGEYGTSFHYVVPHAYQRLELTVWPLNADVSFSIYVHDQVAPIFKINLLDCPGARVVQDKRGKFIEFAAANIFSGRFDNTVPAPYGFRLWLDPHLQVEPYAYSI